MLHPHIQSLLQSFLATVETERAALGDIWKKPYTYISLPKDMKGIYAGDHTFEFIYREISINTRPLNHNASAHERLDNAQETMREPARIQQSVKDSLLRIFDAQLALQRAITRHKRDTDHEILLVTHLHLSDTPTAQWECRLVSPKKEFASIQRRAMPLSGPKAAETIRRLEAALTVLLNFHDNDPQQKWRYTRADKHVTLEIDNLLASSQRHAFILGCLMTNPLLMFDAGDTIVSSIYAQDNKDADIAFFLDIPHAPNQKRSDQS